MNFDLISINEILLYIKDNNAHKYYRVATNNLFDVYL